MNKFSLRLLTAVAIVVAFAGTRTGRTFAATYTWDQNGAGAGSGGTGAWDTTSAFWNSGGITTWADGATNDAVFPNTAGTVTIAAGQTRTANFITFSNPAGNYTIAAGAGGALSLTDSTKSIVMQTNTGSTNGQIISAPIGGTDITVVNNLDSGTFVNSRTLLNLNGTNTFTGNLNLTGAFAGTSFSHANQVSINSAGALPGTATVNFARNFSQLLFTSGGAGGTVAYSATFNNNINLNSPNVGTFTSGIGSAVNGTVITLDGVISGTADLSFTLGTGGGQGTIVVNNSGNNYTGRTTISNATAGIVRLGVNNSLPTTTALAFGLSAQNVGSVDMNGKNQTVVSLGSGTTGTVNGVTNTSATLSTLTINGVAGTNDTAYKGQIGANSVAGSNDNIALNLASTNTAVLTLTGPTTYSGGTTIDGGTLKANNTTGSATGTGNVTVGTGGTLGGTGTVGGNVLSSGTLSPGNSVGSFTIDGTPTPSLSLLAGSYKYEINSNTSAADLTSVRGNLNITAGTALAASDLGGTLLALGTKFTLINYGGTWNGGTFNGLPDEGRFFVGVNNFQINYNDTSAGANGGSFGTAGQPHWVTITAVPEASSIIAFGLCGVFAFAAVRLGKRFGFSLLKI